MDVRDAPRPLDRTEGSVPTYDYRVVFWWHQKPPPESTIRPEDMGWGEITLDFSDASGVHEVIAWAEEYLVTFASEVVDGSEHTYCLYARVPTHVLPADERGAGLFLHLAGRDPTTVHDPFERMHPFL